MFLRIVDTKHRSRLFWALAGINALIHLTAFFSNICFSINSRGEFCRGPLGYTCHIVSKSEAWILILYALLIVAAVVADSAIAKGLKYPSPF